MLQELRISLVLLVVLTVLTGGIYPVVVTLVAQIAFPHAANGSFLRMPIPPQDNRTVDGTKLNRLDWQQGFTSSYQERLVGSALIGQPFTMPRYFWGRPSATAPFPDNAASSSGSNLGPMNPDLQKRAQARIDKLREFDAEITSIPVDLVTTSASGLDPHISPGAAEAQVRRVAKARQMSENDVRTYIRLHTRGRQFGILGEPVVNVLQLNLDLDRIQAD